LQNYLVFSTPDLIKKSNQKLKTIRAISNTVQYEVLMPITAVENLSKFHDLSI